MAVARMAARKHCAPNWATLRHRDIVMSKMTVLFGVALFFLWIIYLRMEKDQERYDAQQRDSSDSRDR